MNTQTQNVKKIKPGQFILKYNAVVILIVLIAVSAILSPAFLTSQNIFNLLRQNAPLAIMSMGMLYVILTGGIDLSVGMVAGASGMLFTVAMAYWGLNSIFGLIISILITVAFGCIIGAISGGLVAKLRMAPFIVTLAFQTIAKGIAYLITNGQPERWPADVPATDFMLAFGSESFLGIPWAVWLAVVVIVIFALVTKFTTFGRLTIAIGSNEVAVRLSGINDKKYKFCAYVISGAMGSLAAICLTARTGMGAPTTGDGYELDAIAACVIGGASLMGGKGSVGKTVIGVLVLALITNIMNLLSLPAYPQQIIKGVVILAAVLLQSFEGLKRQ